MKLSDFETSKTLVLYMDRIHLIKNLMAEIPVLQENQSQLLKLAPSTKLANPLLIYEALNNHIFVLYRSLFQASCWEKGKKGYIDEKQFNFTDEQLCLHDEIIEHVNQNLAHQDLEKSKNRSVVDGGSELGWIACRQTPYHAHKINELVACIKNKADLVSSEKSVRMWHPQKPLHWVLLGEEHEVL